MAGDDGSGEGIPVVSCPSVVPRCRSADDGGIGGPTGDHDVGTTFQGVHDAPASEVGVGADEAARVGQRLAGGHVGQVHAGCQQVVQSGDQVVTVHVGDGRGQSQLGGDIGHGFGTVVRVQPAGIGDDLYATVQAGAHDLFHLGHEGPGVAGARALGTGAGQDQHRQFGQPVSCEHVDRAAVDHLACGREAVAVEAGTVGDADRFGHVSRPRPQPRPVR